MHQKPLDIGLQVKCLQSHSGEIPEARGIFAHRHKSVDRIEEPVLADRAVPAAEIGPRLLAPLRRLALFLAVELVPD
jgi:hypothetical protein